MQNKFQTNSGEYSVFSLGWQSYFPEYLKQQMVVFPANIMDCGSTLSKADIYYLNVITQATVSCPYPSNCMYFHLEILILIRVLHPGFTKGSNAVFGGSKCQHPKRSQFELEYD